MSSAQQIPAGEGYRQAGKPVIKFREINLLRSKNKTGFMEELGWHHELPRGRKRCTHPQAHPGQKKPKPLKALK